MAISLGLFMIAYGMSLRERIEELPLWTKACRNLSEAFHVFLQRLFNLMLSNGFGQRHLKFKKYLKDTGLDEAVSPYRPQVTLTKEKLSPSTN